MNGLESPAIEGDSPVTKNLKSRWNWHPSSAGHEKSCVNQPGPSGKTKYFHVTDSELVPWGKGEKYPDEGSEKDLKPIAYKQ